MKKLILVGGDRRLRQYRDRYHCQIVASFPNPGAALPYVMAVEDAPVDGILVDIADIYDPGVEETLVQLLDGSLQWEIPAAIVLGQQHMHLDLQHGHAQRFGPDDLGDVAQYLDLPLSSGEVGMVAMVLNGKGGVGKSSVAANVARALSGQFEQRVAAVDSDFFDGNLSPLLGLPHPQTTILDLIERGNVRQTLHYMAEADGIDVLPAPPGGDFAQLDVSPRKALGVLEELRDAYDWIVVDTPPDVRYSSPFPAAIWQDQDVLNWVGLVIIQSQPLERDGAERILRLLDRLDARDHAYGVLVHTRPVRTNRRRLAQSMGIDIVAEIPYDDGIASATTTDDMVFHYNGRRQGKTARAYVDLAGWLTELREMG